MTFNPNFMSKVAFFFSVTFALSLFYYDGSDLEAATWKGLVSAAIIVSTIVSWVGFLRKQEPIVAGDLENRPLLAVVYQGLSTGVSALWRITKFTWMVSIAIFILGGIAGILKFGWRHL